MSKKVKKNRFFSGNQRFPGIFPGKDGSVIQFFDPVLFDDAGLLHPVQQSFHRVEGLQKSRKVHDDAKIFFRTRRGAVPAGIRLKGRKIAADEASDKMELGESVSVIFFFYIHAVVSCPKRHGGTIAEVSGFASREMSGFCFFDGKNGGFRCSGGKSGRGKTVPAEERAERKRPLPPLRMSGFFSLPR